MSNMLRGAAAEISWFQQTTIDVAAIEFQPEVFSLQVMRLDYVTMNNLFGVIQGRQGLGLG